MSTLLFSFSLFCFGSLNASASEIYDFTTFNSYSLANQYVVLDGLVNGSYVRFDSTPDLSGNNMEFNQSSHTSKLVSALRLSRTTDGWTIPININKNYWLAVFNWSESVLTVFPDRLDVFYFDNATQSTVNYPVSDFEVISNSMPDKSGYACYCKIDMSDSSTIQYIDEVFSSGTYCPASLDVSIFLIETDVDFTAEQLNNLITAINNQTTELGGAISDSADQISGTIENQFSGEPDESFNVDDVITQHNENMGVLSFGSDVMLQFLDMFQSANVGSATLTLPGFSIEVQDVNYQVWQDQTFDFAQLEEWIPGLIDIIRVMLPAFVWLMVLRYCISVFERNFLSK